MCASVARQGAAVATLSVFIVPMTAELGWSRAGISGAVSLGGLLGAVIAPSLGRMVDRAGARGVLALGAVVVGGCAFALSYTASLVWFYVFFGLGRMTFSTPFDLGISTAVANWFAALRAFAMSLVTVAIGIGLAVMPLVAQVTTDRIDWRAGWIAVGLVSLCVGALPNWLFMRRRPEDMGLEPDGARARGPAAAPADTTRPHAPKMEEPAYTVHEALRTRSFWLLTAFTGLIFIVQAGASLHQAPHLIERGIDPTVAASMVAAFSLSIAFASLVFGWLARWWPARFGLALSAATIGLGAITMLHTYGVATGFTGSVFFGIGIGGLLTLQPIVFADYFGRRHFGAIRGMLLPVMVTGQAAGPMVAGYLRDAGGNYDGALAAFAIVSSVSTVLVLFAVAPRKTSS